VLSQLDSYSTVSNVYSLTDNKNCCMMVCTIYCHTEMAEREVGLLVMNPCGTLGKQDY